MPYPKNKKRKKLRKILREHYSRGLPFVLYKKPGNTRNCALLQEDNRLDTSLDLTRSGFLMAPFQQEGTPPVLIRADQIYYSPYKGPLNDLGSTGPVMDEVAREIHLKLVANAVQAIKEGMLEKVVVSRRFSVHITKDLVGTYFELTRWYPDAFTYLWHHPEVGTWIGASPELLLRYHSGVSETLALAGTHPAQGHGDDPAWTEKERHEQQIVTDFIIERMQELKLKPQVGEVRNVQAGNLWHLGTEIRTFIKLEQVSELLNGLHPTPAVCGRPVEAATNFILQHENYNREYYTGFLGEVGIEEPESFELFVNLRCAQIRNGRAYIYVGGGITSGSDPEREWEETQAKSMVMTSILSNSV